MLTRVLAVALAAAGCAVAAPSLAGAAGDDTAPVISEASLRPKALRLSAFVAPTLRFTLSEGGAVRIQIDRRLRGRVVKGSCVAPTPKKVKKGAKRCFAYVRVAALGRGVAAGPQSLVLEIRGKDQELPTGTYVVQISAHDKAGNDATPKRLPFTISR